MFFTNYKRCDFSRFDSNRLVNDALLLCIIAHFNMTSDWKIFAKRIAYKTIVCQYATQIWMTRKNLFGEWPDIYTLLGGILVILSCLFISKQPKEKK